jgi:hypothetical protein
VNTTRGLFGKAASQGLYVAKGIADHDANGNPQLVSEMCQVILASFVLGKIILW